jgi:cell division protein FtsB
VARASRSAAAQRSGKKRPARADTAPTGVGRSRLVLAGAVIVAAVVLFAWFPAGSLLTQRSSLTATQNQLSALHAQDAALAQEQKNLSDSSEIGRIAREQYQLVSPGQQAYEVLPPSGSASSGTPYAGDPGSSGPVAPSATPELPPGGVTTTTTTAPGTHATHSTAAPTSGGFFSRVLHSLEFWH